MSSSIPSQVEVEVVRDREGVMVCVCGMENVDPLGIHTGTDMITELQNLSLSSFTGLSYIIYIFQVTPSLSRRRRH